MKSTWIWLKVKFGKIFSTSLWLNKKLILWINIIFITKTSETLRLSWTQATKLTRLVSATIANKVIKMSKWTRIQTRELARKIMELLKKRTAIMSNKLKLVVPFLYRAGTAVVTKTIALGKKVWSSTTANVTVVAVFISLGVIGFALISFFETGQLFGIKEGFSFAKLWGMASAIYIGASFRFDKSVDADEIGVRVFYGFPIDVVGSGPPFLPYGILQIVTFSKLVQQREFPVEPEKIFRGGMKERTDLPEGMKPPVRITFGISITDKKAQKLFGDEYKAKTPDGHEIVFQADVPSDGLSSKRVTAEPVPIVRYRIRRAKSFLQNIGTIEEADRQIEDEIFSVLQRVYTRISLGQALHNVAWINALLYQSLLRRTGEVSDKSLAWGVYIESTDVKGINLNHDLNQAIADAARADFVTQKLVRESEGEKKQRMNRGAGDASAAQALEKGVLSGRASGMKAVADKTGVDVKDVYGGLVAADITKGEGTTFIPGLHGLQELVEAAAATLGNMRPVRQNGDKQ